MGAACCCANDTAKTDMPVRNRIVNKTYLKNDKNEQIITPKKLKKQDSEYNSEENYNSPITPKLVVSYVDDVKGETNYNANPEQFKKSPNHEKSPMEKYTSVQDEYQQETKEDAVFFIKDQERKLYEKIIENSKVEELFEYLDDDLKLLDDKENLIENEEFLEVYNDYPKYDEKYDNEDFCVKVFMKDVYLNDYEDHKFIKTYEEFNLKDINPKNYFFLMMFIDEDNRSKIDRYIENFRLFYMLEKDDKIFYLASYIYKAGIFPSKDEVVVGCLKKMADGSYCSAYKSFKSSNFPSDQIIERVNVINSLCEFRKTSDNIYTVRTSRICDRYSRPVKFIKTTLKTEIKSHFANQYGLIQKFQNDVTEKQHNEVIVEYLQYFKKK